ncbi:hypothetical protein ACFIQG_10300 [Comamonas odontotermitis]|uniref:hypothetical protein n=1 Tax=Comamonas odontotermitis TaxID=379895 RepID=UPI003672ED3A
MGNNVISADFQRLRNSLPSGTEPPDNGDMEQRVAKLEALAEKTDERLHAIENRLTRIEAKQDEFTKHYATKADLTDAKNSIIMWVVSAILLAQLLPALLKKFGI